MPAQHSHTHSCSLSVPVRLLRQPQQQQFHDFSMLTLPSAYITGTTQCLTAAATSAAAVSAAAAAAMSLLLLSPQPQGMGVLDKVVLVFRPQDVFWNRNIDFIINLNMPNDLSGRW